jgi:hypothetical protein
MTPDLANLSYPTSMLQSPAWRVLTLNERRVLDRIAIELAGHGGPDLGVTFTGFIRYGIERHAIAPAIRALVALGFLQITGQSQFRSTYLRSVDGVAPTHDWRRIKSRGEARQIAINARQNRGPVRESPPAPPASVRETPPRRPSSVRKSPPPCEPVEDDDETIVRRPLLKGRRFPLVDQPNEPEPEPVNEQSEQPNDAADDDRYDEYADDDDYDEYGP